MRPRPGSIEIGISAAIVLGVIFALAARPAHAQVCIGDCDSDGVVTLGEVQRAFRVFLGTAPLESCPGFDSGTDGEVSRDEVQVALAQFLASCGGEVASTSPPPPAAEPIHTTTGTQTLPLASAAVFLAEIGVPAPPGGIATVGFSFTSQEGQAAAIGFEVVFDATVVNLETDDCQLSSRFDDQIPSVTFPPGDQPAPPLRRLRFGVFPPITYPIPSFADGELFVCTFGVAGGANPQSTTLVVEPLQVVRADSSVVCESGDCGSVHGSISIARRRGRS